MFGRGVAAVSAPAGLSHTAVGRGGWKSDQKPGRVGGGVREQRGRARGPEGAGAATLCPQLLLMSLGFFFT